MQDENNLSAGMTSPLLPEREIEGVLVPAGIEPTKEDLEQAKELERRSKHPEEEPFYYKWVEVTKKSRNGVEYKTMERHLMKRVIVKKMVPPNPQ